MSDALAWHWQRGLLELELRLGGFLEARRATLLPCETAALARRLGLSDREIVDRLQGGRLRATPNWKRLFNACNIRAATFLELR